MERLEDSVNVSERNTGLDKRVEAAAFLKRAHDVGEAHGFFSVECRSVFPCPPLSSVESDSTTRPQVSGQVSQS